MGNAIHYTVKIIYIFVPLGRKKREKNEMPNYLNASCKSPALL